jgi:hypothetical protein
LGFMINQNEFITIRLLEIEREENVHLFLGMWISPEFQIYPVKEFRRLNEDANRRLSLTWNFNRTLSRLNYRIRTDAIEARLIPPEVTPEQAAITYASEANVLNIALFGPTAQQRIYSDRRNQNRTSILIRISTGPL